MTTTELQEADEAAREGRWGDAAELYRRAYLRLSVVEPAMQTTCELAKQAYAMAMALATHVLGDSPTFEEMLEVKRAAERRQREEFDERFGYFKKCGACGGTIMLAMRARLVADGTIDPFPPSTRRPCPGRCHYCGKSGQLIITGYTPLAVP